MKKDNRKLAYYIIGISVVIIILFFGFLVLGNVVFMGNKYYIDNILFIAEVIAYILFGVYAIIKVKRIDSKDKRK